ncbi:MAG: 30S ribosomal protein S4e [Thaumarchaeota archaeon]|nr:30S ribosomal protein S4e [Nitrososphaerota archaeon]
MGSISGSKKLKRQMAPQFWGITRKNKRFVVNVRPGPHKKERSIPTAVFLRDMLNIVTTLREAKTTIYSGKVKIDGVVRKSLHHAIGLMDVIELENVPDIYRLVPKDKKILQPVKIDEADKSLKLVRVSSKTTISGGKTQIGLHDGRSIITDADANIGDSCLLKVPEQEILKIIKLEPGCQALVTRGVNAGQVGMIESIEEGTFILPRRVVLRLGERSIEIPSDIIILVGREEPLIKIK